MLKIMQMFYGFSLFVFVEIIGGRVAHKYRTNLGWDVYLNGFCFVFFLCFFFYVALTPR